MREKRRKIAKCEEKLPIFDENFNVDLKNGKTNKLWSRVKVLSTYLITFQVVIKLHPKSQWHSRDQLLTNQRTEDSDGVIAEDDDLTRSEKGILWPEFKSHPLQSSFSSHISYW